MRKFVLSTMVAVVVAMATTSFTANAEEGLDVSYGAIVRDAEPEAPAEETTVEPAPAEPTPEPETPAEEPTVEPTPAPAPVVKPTVEPTPAAEEPTVEPTPVVEPTVEPTPAPTPVVKPTVEPTPATAEKEEVAPSSNDDNSNESTDNNTSNEVQSVVDNTPAPAPVVEQTVTPATVVETPVVASVAAVETKKTVAKAAAPVTTSVLGANRVASVPEDEEVVEEVVVAEEESEEGRSLLGALLFAILLGLGSLIFFLLGRKYQVVKKTVNADGEEEEVLKKFFSIEKACEYVRDYQWDSTDADYDSLRIENKSYDEDYEDENGTTQHNGQYVYVVSEDHEQEAIICASDKEVDAIGRILGFVQEEALA